MILNYDPKHLGWSKSTNIFNDQYPDFTPDQLASFASFVFLVHGPIVATFRKCERDSCEFMGMPDNAGAIVKRPNETRQCFLGTIKATTYLVQACVGFLSKTDFASMLSSLKTSDHGFGLSKLSEMGKVVPGARFIKVSPARRGAYDSPPSVTSTKSGNERLHMDSLFSPDSELQTRLDQLFWQTRQCDTNGYHRPDLIRNVFSVCILPHICIALIKKRTLYDELWTCGAGFSFTLCSWGKGGMSHCTLIGLCTSTCATMLGGLVGRVSAFVAGVLRSSSDMGKFCLVLGYIKWSCWLCGSFSIS